MIQEIKSKQEWEGFLAQCERKTFLHSWNWGEFQKSLGNKIWRWGIFETGQLVAVALVIKHIAKRGSFLLIPHGPVMKLQVESSKLKVLQVLTDKLKELAKEDQVDFIRISPIWERKPENEKLFQELGFHLRPLYTHPESSWKLNIEKSPEELMVGMRKTTRYLLKQVQKNPDLEVVQSFDANNIEIFNALHVETVKNQRFIPFSLEYFKKEFAAFAPDPSNSLRTSPSNSSGQVVLFFAKYKGKPIAASYGIFWSGRAFYHHAAMLSEYKKIPAAYLLQWHAIQEAQKKGCTIYDFWGYSDPVKYPKHPYSGPTLFKMGFGGYVDEYVKTQDLPVSPKYWLNYIIETARRLKRGL